MARKLLICTQKINRNDPVLGFFHEWVRELAGVFEQVTVVALEVGDHELPKNVEVYSLGKEQGGNKLRYSMRFFRHVFSAKYDGVFVHMNPEYVLLGGLFWRLLGKKVVLWYNHTAGGVKTKIAMAFANVVCHTSPFAYTAGTKKSKRMPAGIDTEAFSVVVPRVPRSIVYLGRIALVKGVRELALAVRILDDKGIDFSLDVYGDALPSEYGYRDAVLEILAPLIEKKKVTVHQGVPKSKVPDIFGSHAYFVNLTPSGNYDKTVLEAVVAGALPVVSSPAFADFIPPELYFAEGNPASLAKRLETCLAFSTEKQETISRPMQAHIKEKHSLKALTAEVRRIFS